MCRTITFVPVQTLVLRRLSSESADFTVAISPGFILAAPVHDFQQIMLQDPADLVARVESPGAGAVQANISPPVFECHARTPHLLVGKGKIVMRIGVGRRERESAGVSADSFSDPTGLVEHIAQTELSQRIPRLG